MGNDIFIRFFFFYKFVFTLRESTKNMISLKYLMCSISEFHKNCIKLSVHLQLYPKKYSQWDEIQEKDTVLKKTSSKTNKFFVSLSADRFYSIEYL
jgi:hypothetical protein